MRKKQHGFSIIELLVILFVIGAIGFVGVFVYAHKGKLPGIMSSSTGNVNISFSEVFSQKFDGHHMRLQVATKDVDGCSNNGIDHTIKQSGKNIFLSLGDISVPDTCLDSLGPASLIEDLSLENGQYTLQLKEGRSQDSYTLNVTDDQVVIKPVKSTFSTLTGDTVAWTPKNLLWAKCFYSDSYDGRPADTGDYCKRFFDEINKLAAYYINPEANRLPRTAFYTFSGNDEPLLNLVKKYDREGFYVSISTTSGKMFICRYQPPQCDDPTVASPPNLKIEYEDEIQ